MALSVLSKQRRRKTVPEEEGSLVIPARQCPRMARALTRVVEESIVTGLIDFQTKEAHSGVTHHVVGDIRSWWGLQNGFLIALTR